MRILQTRRLRAGCALGCAVRAVRKRYALDVGCRVRGKSQGCAGAPPHSLGLVVFLPSGVAQASDCLILRLLGDITAIGQVEWVQDPNGRACFDAALHPAVVAQLGF